MCSPGQPSTYSVNKHLPLLSSHLDLLSSGIRGLGLYLPIFNINF